MPIRRRNCEGELGRVVKSMGALAIAAAIFSVLAFARFANAAEPSPFSALAGLWTGSGTIALNNGTKERLRCRAQYVVSREGNNLQQALTCNSASYKFHVNAYVNDSAGSLSGHWTETIRNASGKVSGRAQGSKIFISVTAGSAFSAKMSIVTLGIDQTVEIKPKGTDVTDVRVKVRKSK